MKYMLLSLLIVFLLTQTACDDSAPSRKHVRAKHTVAEKTKAPEIKKVPESQLDSSTPVPEKTTVFTGKIMATNAYCGGAYPNDEIMEDLKQGFPYEHKTLRLIPTGKGKAVSFTTDRSGKFSVNIVPGSYRLCPGPRPASSESGYNPNCALWLEHVFDELVIPDKNTYTKNFQVEIPCDPCDPYIRTRP